MECSVGRGLAEAFSFAARRYADTVALLGALNSVQLDSAQILKREEEILRQAAHALRTAEKARMALETHIEQHRCRVSTTTLIGLPGAHPA